MGRSTQSLLFRADIAFPFELAAVLQTANYKHIEYMSDVRGLPAKNHVQQRNGTDSSSVAFKTAKVSCLTRPEASLPVRFPRQPHQLA